MNLLLITAVLEIVFFSLTSILIFLLFLKTKKELTKRDKVHKEKIYQISILREIEERIGYSLDTERVADVITTSMEHILSYTTTSSMVIKDDKIIFKSNIKQPVGSSFVAAVKKNMLLSLGALMPTPPIHIEEQVLGLPLDESKNYAVGTYFNIPIIVQNKILGLINVSTLEKDAYNEEDITLLFQMVGQASAALSKFEDVLETEKGKLTSMIGSLADGVFMVDMQKNLLIINAKAKTFLNIPSDNTTFSEVALAMSPHFNILEKIDLCLSQNKAIDVKEVVVNNKTFQLYITPVPDSREQNLNKPIGASILLHDITTDKNITTVKEDFTHMIVHELRAPLTAIKDSAELMIEVFEDKGTLDKEQQKRLLKIIEAQSKSLLEQINQVLDAAKIEAGSFSIKKAEADIGEVIKSSIEPFNAQAEKKQIKISTDIYFPLPKIQVDSIRITEVLNNLISNSLKFTPEKGKIVVSAKPAKDFVTVSVTDTGIGIPKNEQKDLFEKYYQIRTNPHDLSKKGTGLGLYIVKGIVEAHGGRVGIVSKEKEGTTISFTLPATDLEPQILHKLSSYSMLS